MKIVVLAGGLSTERDVSFSSGSMVYKALKQNGHQAIMLDVYLGYEGDIDGIFEKNIDWAAEVGAVTEKNPDLEAVKKLRKDGGRNFFGPNVIALCQEADVAFLALHGENGENGKVQAALDLMGVCYTGTDYLSSAICMDKGLTKDMFALFGIPTPAGIKLKKNEEDKREVPFPCVVKACCGGSSVGVAMANNEEEYENAKKEAFRYDDEVVIEQYIKGREFSVGVMDGKDRNDNVLGSELNCLSRRRDDREDILLAEHNSLARSRCAGSEEHLGKLFSVIYGGILVSCLNSRLSLCLHILKGYSFIGKLSLIGSDSHEGGKSFV